MASVVTTTDSTNTPISNFIDYFNNVKPYHSKILEINQKYNFSDNCYVNIQDTISNQFSYANEPLCNPIGFGYEFDSCDGYDAIDGCDLGTCTYDSTFLQNLSPVKTLSIDSVNALEGTVTVTGNYTFDQTFPIKSINSTNNLTVKGDLRSYLGTLALFKIISKATVPYTSNSINTLNVTGNYSDLLTIAGKIYVYGSTSNNGVYTVANVTYFSYTNITQIMVYGTLALNDLGTILIKAPTRNNGYYKITNYTYNGQDTVITIDKTKKALALESVPTSIVLPTGFIQNRFVNITNNDDQNNGTYQIAYSEYDGTDSTIHLVNMLTHDTASIGQMSLMIHTNYDSYISDSECGDPKESNIDAKFSEVLVIQGGMKASITPTPTMTATPTPTPTISLTASVSPTPTMSPTPTQSVSPTPSLSLSPTPSISISATPSPTPSITPSITPTLTRTPSPSVSRTPSPSITPSPSPTYAPLSFYIKDGDPRSSVYMANFGKPSTISISCTAGNYNYGLYNGTEYSVDPSTGNVVSCTNKVNTVWTPTSRPPQFEDNNSKTNMPIIFPTGGSGHYKVTIENLVIQCQKQAYADGPSAVGLVQATSSNKTTISTYCGNAIMSNNNGSAWVFGGNKDLILNTYYGGYGPFFGMVSCSGITDYQMLFVFTMVITDTVTGHTLSVPGLLAVDRSGTGSQGDYNPCNI